MNELLRWLLFLPEQASTFAPEIDALHYFVIATTLLGATSVALVAIVFIVRHRYRKTRTFRTRHVEVSRPVEVGVGLSMLVLFLAIWRVGFDQYVRLGEPPADALPIHVTAKQWMWEFAYPSGPSSLPRLYVPAHRPVKLLLGSRDVIHSFSVPAFRVKRDVVPGYTNVAWFEATEPGRYEILCAEYCGADHSRMRGEVVVLRPEDYDAWIQGQRTLEVRESDPDLVALGRRVAAEKGCLQCHAIEAGGPPRPAPLGPSWVGLFGSERPLEGGGRALADEAYLTESMIDPGAKVVRGYAPVMPSYRGRLEPAETAALLELIRSLGRRAALAPGNTRARLEELR